MESSFIELICMTFFPGFEPVPVEINDNGEMHHAIVVAGSLGVRGLK